MARAVDLETRTAMLLDELIRVKEVEFVLDTVVDVAVERLLRPGSKAIGRW